MTARLPYPSAAAPLAAGTTAGQRAVRAALGRRGLTLIEVLVAVAVMALTFTLAFGVMMTTIDTQDESLEVQQRYQGGRIALERLGRELSMAFVSLHQAEDKRTITLFRGEDDEIIFDTAAHEPLTRNVHQSDQLELAYYIKPMTLEDGTRSDVLVRRVKFHIDDRPGDDGREEVLVDGVRKLEFEYYDEIREDWQSEWEVEIDDALEMRERLKQVQQIRDAVEDLGADDSSGIAGAVVAAEADEQIDVAEQELMDGLFLPARVKIRLTLDGIDDVPIVMETQVEIPMTEPLWF